LLVCFKALLVCLLIFMAAVYMLGKRSGSINGSKKSYQTERQYQNSLLTISRWAHMLVTLPDLTRTGDVNSHIRQN
jgi:hypothetical protein